jgi:hypothetical protein
MPDLTIVTATWATPFAADVWNKLDGLKRAASKEGDLVVLGPSLPDDEDDRTAEVAVHHHGEDLQSASSSTRARR